LNKLIFLLIFQDKVRIVDCDISEEASSETFDFLYYLLQRDEQELIVGPKIEVTFINKCCFVFLLVLTSLEKLILILKILLTFLQNKLP